MRSILAILLLFLGTITATAQTSDSVVVQQLRTEGVQFSHDNTVTLLMHGQEKFDDMFTAIRQARHSVHLEYFNFRNDSIAFLLFDILAQKAQEGVEVRALFDAFGNSSNNRPLKNRHIRALRERGIQIHEFDPLNFPWLNHVFGRDHRKIVIIDGQIAYTGGMNVADYYIKGTPAVGEWRDMHCRIEGSTVNELQDIFIRAWEKVTHEDIAYSRYFNAGTTPMANQALYPQHPFNDLTHRPTPTDGHMMCGIVNREPHRTPKATRQFYYHAINSAQDTIRIVNPYFTLIPKIRRAIVNAVRRGVVVQIMIAEPSDVPLTPDCVFYNANRLQRSGCQVWVYKPGFHHTKVIMVDGRYCTVGSTNLDARSLRCDFEENVAIIDPHITRQLTQMFERDKLRSFQLTDGIYRQWRTPWQRFRGWFAHLLAPFL